MLALPLAPRVVNLHRIRLDLLDLGHTLAVLTRRHPTPGAPDLVTTQRARKERNSSSSSSSSSGRTDRRIRAHVLGHAGGLADGVVEVVSVHAGRLGGLGVGAGPAHVEELVGLAVLLGQEHVRAGESRQ